MKKSSENVDQHLKTNVQDPKATKKDKTNDSQSQRSAAGGNQVQEEDEAGNRPIGRAHVNTATQSKHEMDGTEHSRRSKDDSRDSAAKTKGNKSQK